MGYPVTSEFLANDLFMPANGSNSLLYERALALLRKDVLLQTVPIAAERSEEGAKLVVESMNGTKTLIKAKKVRVPFVS
jgi:hypothetical protein